MYRLALIIYDMTSEEFGALLKAADLRVTAQRLALLKIIDSQPHITAEELVTQVNDLLGSVSRQAVYDSVGALTSAGILRRSVVEGKGARYEIETGDNHHHLWCYECGRYENVPCHVGTAPCMHPSQTLGFSFNAADVIYRGICPECQETSNN